MLILHCTISYNHDTTFPGINALPPVIGTMLIILFSTKKTLVNKFLSAHLMIKIGLISYSAYLYHQPIFSFYRLLLQEQIPLVDSIILSLSSLLIGAISYKFIERPFRNSLSTRNALVFIATSIMILIASATLTIIYDGFPNRYINPLTDIVRKSPSEHGKYLDSESYKISNKNSPKNTKNLLIIGDSFSQDFYNITKEVGAFSDYNIYTRYIPARCQPLVHNKNTIKFISLKDKKYCKLRGFKNVVSKKDIEKANVVIFAPNWRLWSAKFLTPTLKYIQKLNNVPTFLIGSKKFGDNPAKNIRNLWRNYERYKNSTHKIDITILNINEQLQLINLPNTKFINIQELHCKSDKECSLLTDEGSLISYDGIHLTKQGAKYFGKLVYNDSELQKYLSQN